MHGKSHRVAWLVSTLIGVGLAQTASALPVTVNSTDSIYDYNSGIAGGGSTTPISIALPSGINRSFTLTVTGLVSLTGAYGSFGGDGNPTYASSISGAAGLSGIDSSSVGFLVGAFLDGGEPSVVPATLNFSSSGTPFNFSSLSPLIDQVFFIGDGLTGTGTGGTQIFYIPDSATNLILGIADAYGYSGAPGAYYDNSGAWSVDLNLPDSVPEPATWAMFVLGVFGIGLMLRKKSVEV